MNIAETIQFLKSGRDVDAQIEAFNDLESRVTETDVPILLAALESDTSDFWVRELLAQPIIRLSGAKALPQLMAALRRNFEEGHDNDGFAFFLIELAKSNPDNVRGQLQSLAATAGKAELKDINWLLEYCT
jgi:hypothetical protein